MVETSYIAGNLREVNDRIAAAASQAGRKAHEITLVAVSKTFSAEIVRAAVGAGAADLGESRVQEGTAKIDELGRIARWHLIGNLQKNKARRAVEYFDMIHSIDSFELAVKVAQYGQEAGKVINCLIEVNSSGEESKFGFDPNKVPGNAERIAALRGINLKGMMTIGPWTSDEYRVKKAFDETRKLFEKTQAALGRNFEVLSMGMSADFELAIACGSTMVRVGTAIFGKREK